MGQNPNLLLVDKLRDFTNKYRESKGLTWPLDKVTYLGITIPVGKEKKNIFDLDFANIFNKIRSI